jgi:hypothetical protein
MPTIRQVIDFANTLKVNSFTDAQKLAWLNEVEQSVKEEIMRTYLQTTVRRLTGVTEYSLPNGVTFEDVEVVYIDRVEADKLDQRSFLDSTYGDRGYYKPTTASKFAINPAPLADDDSSNPGIRLVYLDKFTAYTDANTYGTSMLITQPKHQKAYTFYLLAQIDLFNQEYENYNNKIIQYNAAFKDFSDWWKSRQPTNKSAVIRNLW